MFFRHLPRALSVLALVLCLSCQGSDFTPIVGLTERPSNKTCLAPPKPSGKNVAIERAFPNLTFTQPLALRQRPGDNSLWYVAEKGGVIRVFDNDDMAMSSSVFLDISSLVVTGGEAGLLSFEFHPDYPDTAEVFVTYVRSKMGGGYEEVLARFVSPDMGDTLYNTPEDILVTVDEPLTTHNGGDIHFDSTGLLYWSLGDGGYTTSTQPNGQDTSNILGAVLRLDPDGDDSVMGGGCDMPYGIPAGNPFDDAACPTGGADDVRLIYAWGFRNPWRWSFDAAGAHQDSLWLADVGQASWEEVNLVTAGANYGWAVKEGFDCFPPGTTTCDDTGMTDPLHVYSHDDGSAITGGYLYNGTDVTDFVGEDVYLFGDFGSGNIWGLFDAYGTPDPILLFAGTGLGISAFGEDVSTREIYVVDLLGGGIHRIVDSPNEAVGGFPALLSESGCVNPASPLEPAKGVIPYEVNAPFWTDGAFKERFIAIPDGTRISVGADGDWEFPAGSMIMKHFYLNDRPIETRFLVRHDDGQWQGYSYEWRTPPTDADLLPAEGKTIMVEGQQWLYPGRGTCIRCHTGASGFTLGPKSQQLNKIVSYGEGDEAIEANQLTTFEWIGLLDSHANVAPLVDPTDESKDVNSRARSWLDTNCSMCHQPDGPVAMVDMDLRYQIPLADMNICNATALYDPGYKRLAPGDPENSLIHIRTSSTDYGGLRMPPLGSFIVDTDGTDLLDAWITSIGSCP
ncbi:MAG: PQQ-dependent sugar dehydrogenase [Chrysiogenetes bacterium]|nr:PQQ-dependent sugar dehydrogenase [Chrysiogenetes bacterium]